MCPLPSTKLASLAQDPGIRLILPFYKARFARQESFAEPDPSLLQSLLAKDLSPNLILPFYKAGSAHEGSLRSRKDLKT